MLNIGSQSYRSVPQAIEALEGAVREAGQGDADAHRALGEALALAGRADEAIEAYRAAMRAAPSAADHVRLAEMLTRRLRPREARPCLAPVLAAVGPGHPWSVRLAQTLDELADAFFAAGELEGALRCHDEAWRVAPGHVNSAIGAALKRYQDEALKRAAPSIGPASAGGPSYYAALVVWGEAYARDFLEVCAPSLLAPGNLPYLAERERIRLLVFADRAAREALEKSAAFAALRAYAEPLFVDIPDVLIAQTRRADLPPAIRYRNTLRLVTAQHQLAMIMAAACGAGLFFLVPDWVLSSDCLRTVHAGLQRGEEIFAAPILVAGKRGISEALATRGRQTGVSAVPARELARLGARHLHDSWRQFIARDDCFEARQFPSWMLWSFAGDGLVLHAFHWSVLCVAAGRLAKYRGQPFWTLDHRLLDVLLEDDADWRSVIRCTDTDALTVLALEDEGKAYAWAGAASRSWRLPELIAEAMPGTTPLSLSRVSHLLFREPAVFGGEGDAAARDEALARARAMTEALAAQVPEVSIRRV